MVEVLTTTQIDECLKKELIELDKLHEKIKANFLNGIRNDIIINEYRFKLKDIDEIVNLQHQIESIIKRTMQK